MLFPLLVAAGSVALGAALAAVPGARRALGPVRSIVLALALGVAVISLIPAAWRALGAASLLGVAIGFGVLAFQQGQVRRRELEKAVSGIVRSLTRR